MMTSPEYRLTRACREDEGDVDCQTRGNEGFYRSCGCRIHLKQNLNSGYEEVGLKRVFKTLSSS